MPSAGQRERSRVKEAGLLSHITQPLSLEAGAPRAGEQGPLTPHTLPRPSGVLISHSRPMTTHVRALSPGLEPELQADDPPRSLHVK